MKALDCPALFTMPDAAAGLFHDFCKIHFVLQRWEFATQARNQLNENAFYPWIKRLAVAIEQPNLSEVLHDSSRVRREGGGGISGSFCNDAVFMTLLDV